MKKIKRVVGGLAALALASSAGCASIVSKSRYPIIINSSPSGATVTVKNKSGMEINKAVTPATIVLPASEGFFQPASYSFQFEKEGYNSAASSISASIDPWYVGNLFFGGLIGLIIVDPATGAMWKLDNTVYTGLSENNSSIQDVSASSTHPNSSKHSEKRTYDAPSQRQEIILRLKELKNLKDSEILTDEEYESKRKLLVERL